MHRDAIALWLQQRVRNGDVVTSKIKTVFDTPGPLSAHQGQPTSLNLIELMGHWYEDGGPAAAPQLNSVDGHNGLDPLLFHDLGMRC